MKLSLFMSRMIPRICSFDTFYLSSAIALFFFFLKPFGKAFQLGPEISGSFLIVIRFSCKTEGFRWGIDGCFRTQREIIILPL